MNITRFYAIVLATALCLSTIMPMTTANAQTKIARQAIAKAEAVVKQLQNVCSSDIKNYCSKVTLGEGRMALCMMAHEDQITDKCYGAIFDAVEGIDLAVSNVWRAAEVCEGDIEKICSKVEPGEGRIAQCLVDNRSKLATRCRAEVAGFEARMKK